MGLLIDAIAVSGDAGLRSILVDDIDHREFDVLVTRRCETQSAPLACLASGEHVRAIRAYDGAIRILEVAICDQSRQGMDCHVHSRPRSRARGKL